MPYHVGDLALNEDSFFFHLFFWVSQKTHFDGRETAPGDVTEGSDTSLGQGRGRIPRQMFAPPSERAYKSAVLAAGFKPRAKCAVDQDLEVLKVGEVTAGQQWCEMN